LQYSDVWHLPWLASCWKETIRVDPSFVVIGRTVGAEPVELGGYGLPAFTNVLVCVKAMNTSQDSFRDPLKWKPQRWLKEGTEFDANFLNAFGGGQRMCPGIKMAFETVLVVMSSLLDKFDFACDNLASIKHTSSGVGGCGVEGFFVTPCVRANNSESTDRSPSFYGLVYAKLRCRRLAIRIRKALRETVVHVLYCSTKGSTEQLAHSLVHSWQSRNTQIRIINLSDVKAAQAVMRKAAVRKSVCIFCCATFYDGAPPDSGKAFHAWIVNAESGSLAGMKFCVFGAGNSTYEHFNWMGREVDQHLARLGAARIHSLCLGDASDNIEGTFGSWQEKVWKEIRLDSIKNSLPDPMSYRKKLLTRCDSTPLHASSTRSFGTTDVM